MKTTPSAATTNSKTFCVVWGWSASGSALVREPNLSKADAWKRVQELMSTTALVHGETKHIALLEVYTSRDDGKAGSEISTFKRFVEGSPFCKWGQWGVSKMLATGEVFG